MAGVQHTNSSREINELIPIGICDNSSFGFTDCCRGKNAECIRNEFLSSVKNFSVPFFLFENFETGLFFSCGDDGHSLNVYVIARKIAIECAKLFEAISSTMLFVNFWGLLRRALAQ